MTRFTTRNLPSLPSSLWYSLIAFDIIFIFDHFWWKKNAASLQQLPTHWAPQGFQRMSSVGNDGSLVMWRDPAVHVHSGCTEHPHWGLVASSHPAQIIIIQPALAHVQFRAQECKCISSKWNNFDEHIWIFCFYSKVGSSRMWRMASAGRGGTLLVPASVPHCTRSSQG